MIPELENNCGSWIVVRRSSGEVLLETFSRRTAEAINQDLYEVRTALQHLVSLNANKGTG